MPNLTTGGASNSSQFITVGASNANILTDGTADNIEIQAALDSAEAAGGGIVFLKEGTYEIAATLEIPSKVILKGQSRNTTILQSVAGNNLTVINNKNSGLTPDEYLGVEDLTVDQQGLTQSFGGGIAMVGVQNSVFRNIRVARSYRFNFLISSKVTGVPNSTGTATFTNGSEVLTGTGTLFTTEYEQGDIIISAGGDFARVAVVNSDTEILLTIPWSHATETGVTFQNIEPNSGNLMENITTEGTSVSSDVIGLGLFDDSVLTNVSSSNGFGAGGGIVPDHCDNMTFVNCTATNNAGGGLSFETVTNSTVLGGAFERNNVGIQLISGSANNTFTGVRCDYNTASGIQISYNVTSFPLPDNNRVISSDFRYNGTYGIRLDGSQSNHFSKVISNNNGTGGLLTQINNGRDADGNTFDKITASDDQTTPTQDYGFRILSGTGNKFIDYIAANNTNTDIADSGTATIFNNHGSSGSGTLQSVVDSGSSVAIADGSNTAITITNNDVTNNPTPMTITNVTTGTGLLIDQNGNGMGVNIQNAGTQDALRIDQTGVLSANNPTVFIDSGVAQTSASLMWVRSSNAGSTQPVVEIENGGSGSGLLIDQNGVGAGIEIVHDDTGSSSSLVITRNGNNAADIAGLEVNVNNAGAGAPIGIDLSSMTTGEANFKFVPDATDPTGGGGAATGRIAIDVGGTIVYIPYY